MHRRLHAFLIVSAMALGALALPAGTAAAEPVVLALNWFNDGDHAPYWVALDKGYYKARGLDVSIEPSKGSGDAATKVAVGRAAFGLADAVPVMSAIGRGAEIKIVGIVFDKTPLTFFSRADKPVTRPKDLEGKAIGASATDVQRLAFPAFAKINGIDTDKITWVNIEPAAKIAALSEKRVDAVGYFFPGRPYFAKALGDANVRQLHWADYGFNDLYSMTLITNDKLLKSQPELVKRFLEASYLGWRDTLKDPQEALRIMKKHVPEIDLSVLAPYLQLSLELVRTPNTLKNGLGVIDTRRMCSSVDIVNTYMGLPRPLDCASVYASGFVPDPPVAVPAAPQ